MNLEHRPHDHEGTTAPGTASWRSRARYWLHHGRTLRALAYVRRLRIRAHHVKRASLVTAGIFAFMMLFVAGVAIRFAMGPVPLGAFSDRLHAAMNNALPGVGVTYEDAALEWSRDEGRFNLIIQGARVFDEHRHIVAQAPKAEIGLAAIPLLRGEIQIRRINLVGVQLTLVRDTAGVLHLGVERNKSQGDVLQHIRDAIEKSGNGPSTLDSFAVSKARIAFYDEASGLFIVAPQAKLEVKNEAGVAGPSPEATVDADIEITGEPAHVLGTFHFPSAGGVAGNVTVTGLKLRALANNAKTFAVLAPFDLQTDVSGSFVFARGTKLRSADLGLDASGVIGGMGSPLKVKSFRFVGRYDAATGRVLVDDANLESEGAKAHFQGLSNLSFAPDGSWSGATLNLTGDQIFVGLPAGFQKSVSMGHIGLRGSYSAASRTFTLDRFGLDAPGLTSEVSGKFVLVQDASPEIDLAGKIGELTVHDLVRYWPLKVGGGARNWIDANMPAGKIGPFALAVNLKPGELTGGNGLPDDALKLTFPISKASVVYIHGLTPMTDARGTGTLTGDTFKAEVTSARVGPLQIGKSQVTIPTLHVPGTVADVAVTLQGQMRDVLTLLDMKPLQYPTRFHIKPADVAGAATISGDVRVPTIRGVSMSQIAIRAKAAVSGFAMSLGTQRLSDGAVNLDIDNQHLHANGNIVLGRTPVNAEWTEIFNTNQDVTSHMIIRGSLDDAARADLHFGVEDVLTGPTNIVANIEGHRGMMRNARVAADLTPATISLETVGYRKPPGTPASAQINAQFDPAGDIASAAVSVSGNGLTAQGTLNFINGKMARADFPVLRAGANNDFALSLVKTPLNGTDISVKGASADGTGFSRNSGKTEAPSGKPLPPGPPLHITARLDRVVLTDRAALSPFVLDMNESGDRVQSMLLNAGGKTNAVMVSIAPSGDGRKLTVSAANAGPLLQGVFGLGDISGGQLEIDAKLPPATTPLGRQPDYVGTLVMRDFRIENQPFFARLFSAGSLGGLVDLMRGAGIGIDKLTLPFTSTNNVIDIREAHANGPSVGLSAEGYIDRRNNTLDLRGAVAPIYGLNGMLNSIPLIGSILTSKKGEGILGVTYEASGSLDEPRISVNPLAMLTPGIFRRIFEGAVPSAPAQIDTGQPAQKPH